MGSKKELLTALAMERNKSAGLEAELKTLRETYSNDTDLAQRLRDYISSPAQAGEADAPSPGTHPYIRDAEGEPGVGELDPGRLSPVEMFQAGERVANEQGTMVPKPPQTPEPGAYVPQPGQSPTVFPIPQSTSPASSRKVFSDFSEEGVVTMRPVTTSSPRSRSRRRQKHVRSTNYDSRLRRLDTAPPGYRRSTPVQGSEGSMDPRQSVFNYNGCV